MPGEPSVCDFCAAPVVRMDRAGRDSKAPFQPAGARWVPDADGDLVEAETYIRHVCLPKNVEAVKAFRNSLPTPLPRHVRVRQLERTIVERDKVRALYAKAKKRQHDAVEAKALLLPCARCGAEPGERCEDLRERSAGRLRRTKNSHPGRIGLIDVDQPSFRQTQDRLEMAREQLYAWNAVVEAMVEQARLHKTVEGWLSEILDRVAS